MLKMEAIVTSRRGGKTSKLIKEYFLKSSNAILLVSSEREKERIVSEYKIDEKDKKRIMSWQTAKERLPGVDGEILLDNADWFFQEYFCRTVKAIPFNRIENTLQDDWEYTKWPSDQAKELP